LGTGCWSTPGRQRLITLFRRSRNSGFEKKIPALTFLLRTESYIAYEINRFTVMNTTKNLKPTDSELEILQVLWEKGNATVREVHEELALVKDCGYTTTLKLMQIMFEKGLVLRDDSNRTHVYQANVSREKTQKQLMNKMVNTLFSGSHTQLVMQALGAHIPSRRDLEEIQQLLDSYKK